MDSKGELMISFVIPAHNEEIWVGRCVAAIQSAAGANGEEYEVIVVDDSSGDATSAVALRHGARVIHVEPRHISAARNAGAHEAQGDVLFFVDADSLVGARLVNSAMAQIRAGAVGGGGHRERRERRRGHPDRLNRWRTGPGPRRALPGTARRGSAGPRLDRP